MIYKKKEFVVRSKKKINHYFTSDHCMLHMKNLTTIDATKILPCKELSRKLNSHLNSMAMHFRKSCKKKKKKLQLQEELANSIYIYIYIRWLSW